MSTKDIFIYNPVNKGEKLGQNINYYYSDRPLTYSKKITDKNGNILGYNEFEVYLALKPVKNLSYTEVTPFEVVEYNFINCSLAR